MPVSMVPPRNAAARYGERDLRGFSLPAYSRTSWGVHAPLVAAVLQPVQSPPRCQHRRERPKFAPTLQRAPSRAEGPMLHYAVVFFVIAIIAAVLGFGGIAAGA